MNSTNASNSARNGSNSGKTEIVQSYDLSGHQGKLSCETHQLTDAYQIPVDLNFEEDDERDHTLED